MGQVTITIDKREYAIACDDGQEAHILKLSQILNEKAKMLSASVGLVNENMMLAMIGLLLADELQDIRSGANIGIPESDVKRSDTEIAARIDSQTDRITQLIKDIKPL